MTENNTLVYSRPRADDNANGLLLYFSRAIHGICKLATSATIHSQTGSISARVILLQIVEGKVLVIFFEIIHARALYNFIQPYIAQRKIIPRMDM